MARISPPRGGPAEISWAAFSSTSRRRPEMTTRAPWRYNALASARPMPVPPPVTQATLIRPLAAFSLKGEGQARPALSPWGEGARRAGEGSLRDLGEQPDFFKHHRDRFAV